MSFVCQQCGNPQKAGVKQTRVVTAIRPVEYLETDVDNRVVQVGQGTEIVSERVCCPGCALDLQKRVTYA